MIVLLVALMGCVGAGNDPAAALEPVLLQEDYQVLQRRSNDRASCVVVLPDEAKAISKFMVTVDDLAGKSSRKAVASPIDFPSGARGMQIDDLAVGGPYTIAIAVHDDAAKPLVQMRRVLVGDLWILGGQSNMYG